MPHAPSAVSFASASPSSLRSCTQTQQRVERRPHGTLLRDSPYGPSRNSVYGWGHLFHPPMTATIPDHPGIHVGISSLNGVPSVGRSDRSMRSLLNQYRKKFNCLEHSYPYHNVGDTETWKSWADMVKDSNVTDGRCISALEAASVPSPPVAEGAVTAGVAAAEAAPPLSFTVNANRFLYTIKANNFLTHVKQLQMDDAEVIRHVQTFFKERCPALEPFLGPVLVQLPPSFEYSAANMQRLTSLYQVLSREEALLQEMTPRSPQAASSSGNSSTPATSSSALRRQRRLRIAVEFRNRSWYRDETFALLRSFRWALVVAHHHDDPTYSQVVDTGAGFLYVRLHGPLGRNTGDYGPVVMRRWAEEMVQYLYPTRNLVDRGAASATPDETAREVFFFLNNSDSHVGGTTSSVVDATCLAEQMRGLLQCASLQTRPAKQAAAPAAPRVRGAPPSVVTCAEAIAPLALTKDNLRASPARQEPSEADTPPAKRQRITLQSSGSCKDEVVID
ncbi:hypothetical protein GH5_00219 [Leishmania sp. Ghana 2012 LV757]|uniref:hypothetical protein n=1 Tax=Leishmania sp. Ghana 2012 LV757 TaxID=2803181 RepID=UPI001B41D301|nr:hypothetical protein GH5_00219 [Leishmania sp. Ghana 2012 LV757]